MINETSRTLRSTSQQPVLDQVLGSAVYSVLMSLEWFRAPNINGVVQEMKAQK